MTEIPKPLVQANQLVLAILSGSAVLFQVPEFIALAFLLTLLPVYFGPKANVIFKLARPFVMHKIPNAETEHVKLQRFNLTLAAFMLGLSLLTLFIFGHWFGYVFAGMVTIAAVTALSGFCVGCVVYFRWNQMKYRMKKKSV
ncbi:uncharacterized protein DUF4395 [Salsuginibacillus halophilus]|uniref:Uncharacterized protein DUF4395 n=1 Tax=Salsuginibacillus halophilus TaxID=517424 RepID=A0A2P8HG71_9BACI|nr:DUF4395 domain-containing protein [Salsuginibacillus halophilus]PSL45221.1 uncharacterized protein DUF4395 [Salsuginibacillus halophilus]